MIKNLYIATAEYMNDYRKEYGLYKLITAPPTPVTTEPHLVVEPIFTRDTPEGLAEIIFETYRNPKENIKIYPVGKKFPPGFPDIGYLDRNPAEIYDFFMDDELICYFELSDEEHTMFNNRLQALMETNKIIMEVQKNG